MPSIAEATRSRRDAGHRRVVAGLGLVLVGAVLVALGAAGTTGGSASGLAVGGLALLVCLWVVASRAPLASRERRLAAGGSVVAAASLLSLWAVPPAGVSLQHTLTVGAGLGFAVGLTVLLAAVLAGMTLPGRGRVDQSAASSVAWTRSSSPSAGEPRAADGGTAEDDLSFPLEDD